MDEDRQYKIRARAYELWEQAGKPDGKHAYFWKMAEKDVANEGKLEGEPSPSTDGSEPA